MADLASLEAGDVIRLDTLAGEPMAVLVGNRVSFKARVGKIGRRLAAEITEKVDQSSPVTQPHQERSFSEKQVSPL
jgi:flagellar motor switch protein FliM